MAGALVQLMNSGAASLYGKSHHNSKQRGVANIMLCNKTSVQIRGGLRISTPSLSLSVGGGGFNNAVDNKFQPASRGRGTRFVARATSSSFEKFTDRLIFTDHMSSRFTDKGVEVIKLAHKESRRMGHNYVGTEQILLGLIAQENSIAADVLKSMGISLEDARTEVEKIINERGHDGFVAFEVVRVLVRTPEEGRVLRHTLEEAGRNYICPEHWLLGLLREDECGAVRVLENLGADASNIRAQVIQMINGETTEVTNK